jgi:glycosyltransferase involved in cell wall biosynthesis
MKLKGVRFLYISRVWLPLAGGAELEAHNFVLRLISQGAEVEVVCFIPEDAIESKFLPTYPITRIIHPDSEYKTGAFAFPNKDWCRSQLHSFLLEGQKKDKWDVVIHFNYLGPGDSNYDNHNTFREWLNIGRIWDPPFQLKEGWTDWPQTLNYDMVLFPTQYHVSATENYNHEPKMVIPPANTEVINPIESLDGWKDRPYDFGFVNAITHKGLNLIIKLIGRMPDKTFLIKRGNYGNQYMVDYMDKWFDNVTIAGWYDDMNDYYKSCKSILYPSLQEGFGMVSYEAMANGCLTFANAHPVMLSACPTGPIYIDAYPEQTKINWLRYYENTFDEDIDADMELAAELWEDEIRDVLNDPTLIDQHQKEGLEAIPSFNEHIDLCYERFYDFVLENYK